MRVLLIALLAAISYAQTVVAHEKPTLFKVNAKTYGSDFFEVKINETIPDSSEMLVIPLDAPFGAIVQNLDMSASVDQATKKILEEAFEKYGILIFRGQKNLTPDAQIEWTRMFEENPDDEAIARGEILRPYKGIPMPDHPLLSVRGSGKIENHFGLINVTLPSQHILEDPIWHVDSLGHFEVPPLVNSMYHVKAPAKGGNTMFVDTVGAFNRMPFELQDLLKEMQVTVSGGHAVNGLDTFPLVDESSAGKYSLMIPALGSYDVTIDDWTTKESEEFLQHILDEYILGQNKEHVISLKWEQGDMALFRNRQFLHAMTPESAYRGKEDRIIRFLFMNTKTTIGQHRQFKIDGKPNLFASAQESCISAQIF